MFSQKKYLFGNLGSLASLPGIVGPCSRPPRIINAMSSRHEWDCKVHQRACNGNADAFNFLTLWARYVHEIDDLVDGDRTGHEALLATFAFAIELYSHPFYLRHLPALRQVA